MSQSLLLPQAAWYPLAILESGQDLPMWWASLCAVRGWTTAACRAQGVWHRTARHPASP